MPSIFCIPPRASRRLVSAEVTDRSHLHQNLLRSPHVQLPWDHFESGNRSVAQALEQIYLLPDDSI